MSRDENLEPESTFEPESQVGLVDFIDEFVGALRKQLHSDFLRWGSTWRSRPKEGQELRTMYRYDDYFDRFRETGEPVPWLKIVGGALICWIRDNHPEQFPDVNEVIVKDMERIGLKVSVDGVEDIVVPVPPPVEEYSEADVAEAFDPGAFAFKTSMESKEEPKEEPEEEPKEKPVEDMTTKELIESPVEALGHGGPVLHTSTCAIYNEPSKKCDCRTARAHILYERVGNLAGKFAYRNVVLRTVVFTKGHSLEAVDIGHCNKDGVIRPPSGDFGLGGQVYSDGRYGIGGARGLLATDKIYVSYDYEYTLSNGSGEDKPK